MAFEFEFRRGTAAAWTLVNPVLADGEPGWERDTHKLKMGDGVTAWSLLPYVFDASVFLTKGANLSDVLSAVTARGNLGLGSAATHPSTDFDTAGAATTAQTAAAAYTDGKIAALVGSAPGALDTLQEIDAQLAADEGSAAALAAAVAAKPSNAQAIGYAIVFGGI